jgi:hypothetical protein
MDLSAEEVDIAFETKDREIAELGVRIDRLERPQREAVSPPHRAFRSALSKPGSDLSSASRAIVSESRM